MSPYQHGEVYVTEDGLETDLDLGHYERFIDEDLNKFSNLTTGRGVLERIKQGAPGGVPGGDGCRSSPTSPRRSKAFSTTWASTPGADVVISEIGGTAGDIESQPFLEAIRQVGQEVGPENALYIHVTLVPYLKSSGEHKSKPTQHSVKELQSMGIKPDIIVLRTDEPITDESIFQKIALFCNVRPDCVIENLTIPVLYEAPLMLEKHHFSDIVCRGASPGGPCPGPLGVDGPGKTDPLPQRDGAGGIGGQVRQAPRRLPLGDGGAAPRGATACPRRWTSTGWTLRP